LGELWQAALVLSMGVFIGSRVDRERQARNEAETRERERRASEDRYRGLFDVAADAILLMDPAGRILEANPASAALLDLPAGQLRGTRLPEQFPKLWRALTSGSGTGSSPLAMAVGTHQTWVQPLTVQFDDADGQPRLLAQLHDVTLARERQHLLETFARDTISAREEERRRVSRELHDGPLQSLMLLWRSLDALEQPAQGDGRSVVQDARKRAEEAADELRRFSRDLRPSLLDDLGLASALKAEASAHQARTGIAVEFELAGTKDVRLPMEVELTLLRICQEALRNVERHAAAKHVRVRLQVRSDGYRMTVKDDGVGIDSLPSPTALVRDGRLGVVGMMERARLVGAECQIGSDNSGTTVEVMGSSLRTPAELDERLVS
ncbi:MAG TPA: histidine kinase, partial [Candidatus Limnocylindrales bacterium]|nr:histidine kinase [Candidatus Limnocylindrales bacterium]